MTIASYSYGRYIQLAGDASDNALYLSADTLNRIHANTLAIGGEGAGLIIVAVNLSNVSEGALENINNLTLQTSSDIHIQSLISTPSNQLFIGEAFILGENAQLHSEVGSIVIATSHFINLNGAGNAINTGPDGHWEI